MKAESHHSVFSVTALWKAASRCMHVVACARIPCLLKAEEYPVVWVDPTVFISLWTPGSLAPLGSREQGCRGRGRPAPPCSPRETVSGRQVNPLLIQTAAGGGRVALAGVAQVRGLFPLI